MCNSVALRKTINFKTKKKKTRDFLKQKSKRKRIVAPVLQMFVVEYNYLFNFFSISRQKGGIEYLNS